MLSLILSLSTITGCLGYKMSKQSDLLSICRLEGVSIESFR